MKKDVWWRSGALRTGLLVLLLGSVWGTFEMTLGGLLHALHVPQTGAIMGSIGISTMAVFAGLTGKPHLAPVMGIIAASFKPADAAMLGDPVAAPYVVNPALAIVLEAVAFGAITTAFRGAMEDRLLARAGAGLAAGAFGYGLYPVLASVAGLGMWPLLTMAERLHVIATNAAPIALAGAFALAAGYRAGRAGVSWISTVTGSNPRLYYLASFVLVLLCWAPVVFHPLSSRV